MDALRSDLRLFIRHIQRRPAFCGAIITILALGLAANVVVFSIVDALAFHPFPFPDPDRLVLVGSEMPQAGRDLGYFERLSGAEISDIESRSRLIAQAFPFDLQSVRVRGEQHAERLFAGYTWRDPFPTLGLEPNLGRNFTASELANGEALAIISHRLWQERFGGQPSALGEALWVAGKNYQIVGIMPPYSSVYGVDLWLPMPMPPEQARDQRQFNLLVRLVPQSDLTHIQAELERIARQVEQEQGSAFREYRDWRLDAVTWTRFNTAAFSGTAVLLLATVALVLLLVCADLANLLLQRAFEQRREIAVRIALGADRFQILRQASIESLGFAVLGGLLGGWLAHLSLDALVAWLPAAMQPLARPPAIDACALGFSVAITLLAAVFFGAAPAWHLTRARWRDALHGGAAHTSHGNLNTQRSLVIAQIALAMTLLVGASSLLQAWLDLRRLDLGFEADHLVSMRLTLPPEAYRGEAVPRFFSQLADEALQIPGVVHTSLATQVAPLTTFTAELHLPNDEPDSERARPFHTVVGGNYFATMGYSLVRGRTLDRRDRDGTPCALVFNELATSAYFPGQDALGKRVRMVGLRFDSGWCEIVGIVATVRHRGLAKPPAPEVFTSHRQAGGRYSQMHLIARTEGDPAAAVPAIRETVKRLDPAQPIYNINTGSQAVAFDLSPRRVAATVLSGFAGSALLLALIGIYGVVAYSVSLRRGEIGLRMALGARPEEVISLVVGGSMRAVAIGTAIGVGAALLLARLLQHQFADAAPITVWHLAATTGLLTTAAFVASWLPALRASRFQPADVLAEGSARP